MHLYVLWRLLSVPFIKRCIPRKYLIIVSVFLWVLFLVGRNLGHAEEGILVATVELLGMNWLASLFLIFVSLLAVDLATAFGLLLPRVAPCLRGLALLAGLFLAVFAHVQGMRAPEVRCYDLHLPGLPDALNGTVIIGVADCHLGSLIGKDWLEERIIQIREEQPDLVVFLGDTFEGHGGPPPKAFVPILRRLSPPMGVWCVPGNHGSRSMPGTMRAAGFKVLENGWQEVRPGLVLAGVPGRYRGKPDSGTVIEALSNRPTGATILLSHKPESEYAEAAARAGAGLMLSGHTHGGQVWPFDYLVRSVHPLLEGKYEVEGMPVIVSRGTGTWGPRMRLWAAGDLLRITLYSDRSALPIE